MPTARSAGTLFAVSTLIWGSTWLAIKYQLGTVAPEASVAYRFGMAAVLLAVWCVATRKPMRYTPRQHASMAAQGGLMFGLNYLCVYWAEQHATSGLVAVLFSTIVFLNPIGARLAFGNPLATRTLAAAALGVTGVALLFLPELAAARAGGDVGLGIVYGLAASVLACGGNLVAVRNQRNIAVLPCTAWGMLYGALVAVLVGTLVGVRWTFDAQPAYVLSLLYLSVFGTVIAFGSYLTLLKLVGPARAAYTAVAIPVVALLLSTLFEGYRWTWVSALGVVLAIVANTIALRPARVPASTPRAT